ncbi:MAG: GNAT family N-acetyltransferase [Planctomycetota bacterium]
MELAAKACLLRPWRKGDEEALVRHAGNRKVWRNLTDRFPHPYTVEDASAWIRTVEEQGAPPRNFAIVVGGEAVGGAGLNLLEDVHAKTADIGYWVGETHWGRGLATQSLTALTDYAFATFELERLQARVFEWNRASCRVLEKAGYFLESRQRSSVFKEGRLADMFIYVRLRSDCAPSSRPSDPCR